MGVGRTPNVLYNGVQGSTGGSTPNVLYNGVQSTHLQPEVFIDEDVIVRGMRTSAAYFIDCGRVRVTLAGRTIVIRTDYFNELRARALPLGPAQES